MATATVTLALNQAAFLAGMARAQSSVASLGRFITKPTVAFAALGAAAVGFGTATAIGIKKAFDLGGRLADMSAISGRSAKDILLLKRALEDAGVSMEKIDRFILTGQDRGAVIARALASLSHGDWADAARSIGTQADILDRNSKTFDRISDLLGRSGDKLQGFFVGAAGKIANALLPLLEKFDKMDFAGQGTKFGAGLLLGAQALVGFFQKPELIFKTATDYFSAAVLGIGNVFVAIFKTGIEFFQNGMFEAIVAVGSALTATLLESLKKPISKLQSILQYVQWGKSSPEGELAGGVSATAQGFRKQASENSGYAVKALSEAAGKFKVEDVFGAGSAFTAAQGGMNQAAKIGRNALPAEMSAGPSRNRRGIIVAGAGGGIDESLFAKNSVASEAEFGSRWGEQKPNLDTTKKTQSDQMLAKILEKIASDTEKQRVISEDAWGEK